MGMEMNIKQILKQLPHRYPLLLVDRILEVEPGRRIVGLKNVSANEPFFAGHFPGHPVMPGVLILEAMAQVGGVLASLLPGAERKMAYFAAIDRCRFRRPVTPGDQLIIEVVVLRLRDRVVRMNATCRANGELVAEAIFTASMVDLEMGTQGLVAGEIVDLEGVES